MDVGVLHRDKKFMEKLMETTKARKEELESLSHKLQVSQGINLHTSAKTNIPNIRIFVC